MNAAREGSERKPKDDLRAGYGALKALAARIPRCVCGDDKPSVARHGVTTALP